MLRNVTDLVLVHLASVLQQGDLQLGTNSKCVLKLRNWQLDHNTHALWLKAHATFDEAIPNQFVLPNLLQNQPLKKIRDKAGESGVLSQRLKDGSH